MSNTESAVALPSEEPNSTPTPTPDPRFDELYRKLKELIAHKGNFALNLADICIGLMQSCEGYTEIPGPQKKALIISVVQKYADEDSGNIASVFIDMLPGLIDAFVEVDKHRLVIITKEPKSCCLNICHIFSNASRANTGVEARGATK
jgi:hypothetical protein